MITLSLSLSKGEMLTSRGDLTIQLKKGRLWVTHEGSPQDRFIPAGTEMTMPKGVLTVLQAEEDTELQVYDHKAVVRPNAPRRAVSMDRSGLHWTTA